MADTGGNEDKAFGFQADGVRRIVDTVRWAERVRDPEGGGWKNPGHTSDWMPYLAKATEAIQSGSSGTFVFYDGKPDDPGDEDEEPDQTDTTEYTLYNRFGDIADGDWLHVGWIQGNWERIGGGGGTTWNRAIVLTEITDETGGPCWIQEYTNSSFSGGFPTWSPPTLAGAQTMAAATPSAVVQAIPWLPLETSIPAGALIILGDTYPYQANSRWIWAGTCQAGP